VNHIVYSFDDLIKEGSTHWDGVRNYQARNFMRDKMRIGDIVLYYHSNTKPPHSCAETTLYRHICRQPLDGHQSAIRSTYKVLFVSIGFLEKILAWVHIIAVSIMVYSILKEVKGLRESVKSL